MSDRADSRSQCSADNQRCPRPLRVCLLRVAPLALLALAGLESAAAQNITEFPIPTPNSAPSGITLGPDGALWFTELNNIGRLDPTNPSAIFEYAVPTSKSEPNGIAVGPLVTGGPPAALWFTEAFASQIGRKLPTGNVIAEFAVTSGSAPQVIALGPDGALWFTERDSNKIGRITPAGALSEVSVPTSNSEPIGITAGPDGNL